jgi:hypothetical protein
MNCKIFENTIKIKMNLIKFEKIIKKTISTFITCRQQGQVFSFQFTMHESHSVCPHGM